MDPAQYGIAGVVILGMASAIKILYDENKRLHEARLEDAKQAKDKLTGMANRLVTAVELINQKLDSQKAVK